MTVKNNVVPLEGTLKTPHFANVSTVRLPKPQTLLDTLEGSASHSTIFSLQCKPQIWHSPKRPSKRCGNAQRSDKCARISELIQTSPFVLLKLSACLSRFPFRLTPVKELHDGTDASNCAIASNFSRSSDKCRSKSSLRRSHRKRIKQTSHGRWIYNGQSHLFHCMFPSLCCRFGWYCSWKCRFGHSESTFTGISLLFLD